MSRNRSLKLSNVKGIRIGEVLLTPEMLEADTRQWQGYALLPGIGEDKLGMSEEQLLRQFCFEYMPFTLTAYKPLVILAEVERFPYSINGDRAYQAFACRLTPESGSLTRLEMHEHHSLAVNSQIFSPEGVKMNLGNGSMYMEVYFKNNAWDSLQPLQPPTGFRKEIILDPNDSID